MEKNENIELKRIFDILKSKMLLIVFILITFTLLGYVYSYYYVVPKYTSTATLLLIPNEGSEKQAITAADLSVNAELISTYSNIAKQPKVLKQVINNLNLDMTEQELLKQMQVCILNSTYIIELSVTNTNPQMAMNITKELSNVFLNEIQEIYNLNNIGVVDEASMPQIPSNVNHLRDIAIFVAGGMVISGFIIMAIYLFDNTVKTEEDIEKYVKIKILGKIPLNQNRKEEIIDRKNAKSYITECINTIRTNILYMNTVKGSKAILITSCTPREGKSWFSTNIATAFAETNKKVLLVDCDMRKGRLHRIFKKDNEEGLSNYLYTMSGNIKKDAKLASQYIQETQIPNLHIITNGTIPPNPSELIDSEIMKEFIELTKTIYDVVIIDAPPCKLVTDSVILSRMVDSTILIANAAKTKMNDLKEVRKSIEIVGGKIIGGVLNQVKMTQKAYGNTYYYGHNEKENKCEVKEKQIISVDEVIEQAMPKFKAKKSAIVVEEVVAKPVEVISSNKQIEYQSENLEQVIDTLLDIKIQLKNNILESKLKDQEKSEKLEKLITQKLEELGQNNRSSITEELQDMNVTEEIAKILNELGTVKANFQIIRDDLEYTIKKGMLSKEEVEDIVKNEMITKETIADIVSSHQLTQQDIESIVNNAKLTKQDVEDVLANNMLTKDNIEEIVTSNVLTEERIEAIVNNSKLTRQDIEEVIANNKLTVEEVKEIVANGRLTSEELERVITNNMLTGKEVEAILRNEMANKEPVEMLTKQDVEEVIASNMLTKENIENIVNNARITKQEIEAIIRNEMLDKETMEAIVNDKKLSKQEVAEIVQDGKLTKEQVEEILKQQLAKINYAEEMKQINEKIMSLQENYLEILNLIKTKQIYLEEPTGKNIIHFNSFKKQEEKKKKRVYSTRDEIIPYEELEKTAAYVIPIKNNNHVEDYTFRDASKKQTI